MQALRALAAALVVLSHSINEVTAKAGPPGLPADYPYDVGVDIFFVISGFVMMYTCRDLFGSPAAWKEFLKKRLIRIVPLYWLHTTLLVPVALGMPSALDSIQFEPRHVLLSYFFMPHVNPAGKVNPFLDHGWTLNYEMYFYLVFASLLFLPRNRMVAALAGYFLITALLVVLVPEGLHAPHFWTRPLVLEFACGAVIGWLFLMNARLPKIKPPVIVLLLGLLALSLCYEPSLVGLAAVVSVVLTTLPRGSEQAAVPRWLAGLGDASYAIYLSHPFVIGALTLRPALTPFALLTLCLLGAGLGGYTIHRTIEGPLLSLAKRYL